MIIIFLNTISPKQQHNHATDDNLTASCGYLVIDASYNLAHHIV